jgi:hypothetical protein
MKNKRLSPIPLFIVILAIIMGLAVAIEQFHYLKMDKWLNPSQTGSKVDPLPKEQKEVEPVVVQPAAMVQRAGENPPPLILKK